MERYRVGLNLTLPEFDTYGVLRKYAEAPTSPEAAQALAWLQHRALLTLQWRTITFAPFAKNMNPILELYLGCTAETPTPQFDPTKMTDADVIAFCENAYRAAGIKVDEQPQA